MTYEYKTREAAYNDALKIDPTLDKGLEDEGKVVTGYQVRPHGRSLKPGHGWETTSWAIYRLWRYVDMPTPEFKGNAIPRQMVAKLIEAATAAEGELMTTENDTWICQRSLLGQIDYLMQAGRDFTSWTTKRDEAMRVSVSQMETLNPLLRSHAGIKTWMPAT